MKYRRNISVPKKDLKSLPAFDYSRLFLQMYYGGRLNLSFVRLLACLDFAPALDLIFESEGKEKTRFREQFPLIDFDELDQVIPEFSNYFVIKTINALYPLLKNRVLDTEAFIDVRGYASLKHIGRYLREYEFYPDTCHHVIERLNRELDKLQLTLATGPSPQNLISEKGQYLMPFIEDVVDYLNRICGPCPNCEIYHGRRTDDFDRPVKEFQRKLIYKAFQLAREYHKGRVLKHRLIPYVFDALQKPSIHALLQRTPIIEKVQLREQKQRDFRRNPYSDSELVITALQNLANASEYSDKDVYHATINAIHNIGSPEDILETKVVALTRLLNQAKQGNARQQEYIPQITRVLNEHRHAAGW